MSIESLYYTPKEAAEYLSVSERRLRDLVAQGQVIRLKGNVYEKKSVDAYKLKRGGKKGGRYPMSKVDKIAKETEAPDAVKDTMAKWVEDNRKRYNDLNTAQKVLASQASDLESQIEDMGYMKSSTKEYEALSEALGEVLAVKNRISNERCFGVIISDDGTIQTGTRKHGTGATTHAYYTDGGDEVGLACGYIGRKVGMKCVHYKASDLM